MKEQERKVYADAMHEVQKKAPLVHCITNFVTVNDCANIILAAGGSPSMAHDIREVEEDDYSFIPWLFQCVPDTPVSAFPERTTLQRKAKEYILSGGKIGIAFGVLK